MSAAAYYHVYLRSKPDVSADEIREKMDLALDWFKYGDNVWILYTSSDAQKLYARYKPLVEPGGNVFICRLDVEDRQGWVTSRLWEWLKKER
jgi:hypothetical protein